MPTLLGGGFERALMAAYSRQPPGDGKAYGNNFSYALQPACCAVDEGHCKIRIPDRDGAEVNAMTPEEKEVWAGNEPGAEAKRLWPGMAPAPHLFSPTHGKRRQQRRLLRKQ